MTPAVSFVPHLTTMPAGTTVHLGPVPGPTTAGTVNFTSPGAADVFTALINWGDGTTSVGTVTAGTVTAAHVFAPGGTYTVTADVTDATDNLTGSATFQITIAAPIVTVSAGADQTATEGAAVTVAATFTDNALRLRTWRRSTGATARLHRRRCRNPARPSTGAPRSERTPTASPASTRSASRSARRSFRAASDSLQVSVTNVTPTVNAGPDVGAGPGVPVHVSATFSDPSFPVGANHENFSATINWGDNTSSTGIITVTPGGPGVPTTGTVTGSHQYGGDGPYTVTVSVSDGVGSGSGTFQVADAPPAVTLVVPTVHAGQDVVVPTVPDGLQSVPVSVNATFSEPVFPGRMASYSATINWGDGTPSTTGTVRSTTGGPGVPTTGTVAGSHVYSTPGRYSVTVTVNDGLGAGFDTLQVEVTNYPPATAQPATSGSSGASVSGSEGSPLALGAPSATWASISAEPRSRSPPRSTGATTRPAPGPSP